MTPEAVRTRPPESSGATRGRLAARLWLPAGFAAVAGLSLWFHASIMPPNHDTMALLTAAARLYEGARYYHEILEVNPPLILIVLSPALGISRLLSIGLDLAALLWMQVLLAASVVLARPHLRQLFRLDHTRSWSLALAILIALSAVPGDFGQRDHLIVAFAVPAIAWYIACELDGAEKHGTPWIPVALACLGFLLKPQSLVIPAFLFGASALRAWSWRRLLNPSMAVFGLVAGIYAIAVILFFPEYLRVAALASELYHSFGKPPHVLIYRVLPILSAAAFTLVVFEILETDWRTRGTARFFGGLAVAGLVTLVLQGKGFSYHYLPGIFATMALMGLATVRLWRGWRRRLPRPAALALGFALLIPVLHVFGSHVSAVVYQPRSRILGLEFFQTARQLAAGQSFLALDTTLGPSFPTVTMIGADWASRSPHQWLIPGIVGLENGDAEERRRAAAYKTVAIDMMVEDLERYRPRIVAVNVGAEHDPIEGPFDFLAFFGADPRFAKLWSEYTLVRAIPGWDFYQRRDAAPD